MASALALTEIERGIPDRAVDDGDAEALVPIAPSLAERSLYQFSPEPTQHPLTQLMPSIDSVDRASSPP